MSPRSLQIHFGNREELNDAFSELLHIVFCMNEYMPIGWYGILPRHHKTENTVWKNRQASNTNTNNTYQRLWEGSEHENHLETFSTNQKQLYTDNRTQKSHCHIHQ